MDGVLPDARVGGCSGAITIVGWAAIRCRPEYIILLGPLKSADAISSTTLLAP
jgi:hypothetical protein